MSSSESVFSWQYLRASQENCETMDTNAKEGSYLVGPRAERNLLKRYQGPHIPNAMRKRTCGSRRQEQISWSRYDFRLTHIHHFDMFQRWCRRIRGQCPHHGRSKDECVTLIRPQELGSLSKFYWRPSTQCPKLTKVLGFEYPESWRSAVHNN